MAKNGLIIDSSSYERSITASKKDFIGDINKLIKTLNGDKYASFKKIIKENWVGADVTDFLNDIEKTKKELEKKLKTLKSKYNSAIKH